MRHCDRHRRRGRPRRRRLKRLDRWVGRLALAQAGSAACAGVGVTAWLARAVGWLAGALGF